MKDLIEINKEVSIKLRQIQRDKFLIILFTTMFSLSLPLIAAEQGKIAFVSSRDGLAFGEIYVMNSDGSNPTRMTFSDELPGIFSFDCEPAFSLDGSKIVYISTLVTDYFRQSRRLRQSKNFLLKKPVSVIIRS